MFAVLDLSLWSVGDESAIVVSIPASWMETHFLTSLFDDVYIVGGFIAYTVAAAHEVDL